MKLKFLQGSFLLAIVLNLEMKKNQEMRKATPLETILIFLTCVLTLTLKNTIYVWFSGLLSFNQFLATF